MQFLLLIIVWGVLAVVWARIFRRMGWSPWYGVLMVIPLSIFILPLVLAFQKWPIEQRVEELERQSAKPR